MKEVAAIVTADPKKQLHPESNVMVRKGKLIVFEGIDGSGKATQAKLLLKHLRKNKIPCVHITFPRYEDSHWGKMVKRFLKGDFGGLEQVNPYLASMLYAGDRFSSSHILKKWLAEGKIVICDRYIGSNIGHMAAKFQSESEKSKYIKWLEDLEYRENGIPKEDLVILLQVPTSKTKELMDGRVLDIHEKDQEYLEKVYEVYDYVARYKKYWEKIECFKNNRLLKPLEIHKVVLGILEKRKILQDG